MQHSRFLILVGIACALMLVNGWVLAGATVQSSQVIMSSGTPQTVEPLFLDPRLAMTIAYPFVGPPGSLADATALPISELPSVLQSEFEATDQVEQCAAVLLTHGSLAAVCQVNEGMDVIGMAELLRQLADRQWYGITLDLTLDDGLTRTNYVWDGTAWATTSLVSGPLDLWVLYETGRQFFTLNRSPLMWNYVSTAMYSLAGWVTTGHSTGIVFNVFETEDEARAAFEAQVGDHRVQQFRGYPMVRWSEAGSAPEGSLERGMIWQAGLWVISIESFDDTSSLSAYDPLDVAGVFYEYALEYGMLTE
jgi:hypothetical protein